MPETWAPYLVPLRLAGNCRHLLCDGQLPYKSPASCWTTGECRDHLRLDSYELLIGTDWFMPITGLREPSVFDCADGPRFRDWSISWQTWTGGRTWWECPSEYDTSQKPSRSLLVLICWTKICVGLPEGAKIVGAQGSGASYWTRTARLDTVFPDGTEKAFFLKVNSPLFFEIFLLCFWTIYLWFSGCWRR